MLSRRPFLIGIAGPSCSGKTRLAQSLAAVLHAPILALDCYYIDLAHLTLPERARTNFDEPVSLDHQLVIRHITDLAEGRAIEKPVYDFVRHTRSSNTEHIEPADFVIVEGLLTLHWPELRRLLALRVFIEVSDDTGFERRSRRDVMERGRTPESVLVQYDNTVRPMASLYVLPTRRFADVVVSGEDPAEVSAQSVLAFVNKATGVAGAQS
jgi:uridine kinase